MEYSRRHWKKPERKHQWHFKDCEEPYRKRWLYEGQIPSRGYRPWAGNSEGDEESHFYNRQGYAHDDHDRRQHRRDDRDNHLAYEHDRRRGYDRHYDYHLENRSPDRGPTRPKEKILNYSKGGASQSYHKSHNYQRSTSTEKLYNAMLDTLESISKICNEELLPNVARMRQTLDESSTIFKAKKCDILSDTLPKKNKLYT